MSRNENPMPFGQPPERTPFKPPKTKADIDKIINDLKTILTLEVKGSKVGKFVYRACEKLTEDPRFKSHPASTSKHHCYAGGLALHTLQTLKLVIGMMNNCPPEYAPDRLALIYATVYHDAGKMVDYKKRGRKWTFSENHDLVGHLVASHKIMRENMIPWSADRQALAEHCVLAHHGRLEWGSPVYPSTVEAWILHTADMVSSRFEDPVEKKRKQR